MPVDCLQQVTQVLIHERPVGEAGHCWVVVVGSPQLDLLYPSPVCWHPRDFGMCEISFAHMCRLKRKLLEL